MTFSKIWDKFTEIRKNNEQELTPDVEDKRLVSLQRQRQKQLNEMEKKRLKNLVRNYNKMKTRKELFGIKDGAKKTKIYGQKKKKFLSDDRPLLKQKKIKIKNMFIK